jgi:hypothetical protein
MVFWSTLLQNILAKVSLFSPSRRCKVCARGCRGRHKKTPNTHLIKKIIGPLLRGRTVESRAVVNDFLVTGGIGLPRCGPGPNFNNGFLTKCRSQNKDGIWQLYPPPPPIPNIFSHFPCYTSICKLLTYLFCFYFLLCCMYVTLQRQFSCFRAAFSVSHIFSFLLIFSAPPPPPWYQLIFPSPSLRGGRVSSI